MRVFRTTWLATLLVMGLLLLVGCPDDDEEAVEEPDLTSIDAHCTGTPVTLYGENLTIAIPFVDDVEVPVVGTPTDSEMLIDPPVVDLRVHVVTVKSSRPEHAGYVSSGFEYSADAYPVSVDGIDPASGPACGGEYVEISGEHFPDNYTVIARASDGTEDELFSASTRASETLIMGITAPHDPGSYEVIVSNPGICSSEASATYTFIDIQCTGTLAADNLQSIEVGPGPHSVAIGDVSNDGNNDVVVGSTGPGRVTVLLGNGGGGFTEYEVDLETADTPIALAISDIDEDGRNDLVAASQNMSAVRVLLQNTSGALEYRSDITLRTGSTPDDIVAVDGNGDGYVDIITADGSSLSVFWGNGDATFASLLEVSVGAADIAAKDYRANATGAVDLAVTSGSSIYSVAWNGIEWEVAALTTAAFTSVDILIEDAGTVVDTAVTFGAGADVLVFGRGDATLGVLYGVEDGLADYFVQHELAGTPVVFERVEMYMEGLFLFQVLTAYESGKIEVLSMVDGGVEPSTISSLELGAAPFSIAAGKLDGGSTDDFVVGMESGDHVYIHVTP